MGSLAQDAALITPDAKSIISFTSKAANRGSTETAISLRAASDAMPKSTSMAVIRKSSAANALSNIHTGRSQKEVDALTSIDAGSWVNRLPPSK